MNNFKTIQDKLEAFINKFYINELIKGAILFFAIGLLYFLFTLFIESVLWLNTPARTVLFWLFVLVELVLFSKFIFLPLAKLFKLKNGINYVEASKIIGTHFPEVNDKLLNVIQLNDSTSQSELLLASIEQKSIMLKPIPFKLAINFKRNISYFKYASIPVILLLVIKFSGNFNLFVDSYDRVTNYTMAFEPPAPFQFFVLNDSLQTVEDNDFKLIVKTAGSVMPESSQIKYNGETYFLRQTSIGEFEFIFSKPKKDIVFQLFANDVASKPYHLKVIKAPLLLSFQMALDYPSYTKQKDRILKGSGNALVPEGTKVTWQLKTQSTNNVYLYTKDTLLFDSKDNDFYTVSKSIYSNLDYTVSTSNSFLKDYEKLSFRIDVVKDEYPELDVSMKVDSLDLQTLYFYGQVSDDYGINMLQLVYYPSDNELDKAYKRINLTTNNISEFITAFPNELKVEEGVSYDLYFQVFDNDAINNFKSVKSNVFTYRKRTQEEEKVKQLNEQNETIQDLSKSLKKYEDQDKKLNEITKSHKENANLSFSDKKKLESFIKRQRQQDQMMKNFNKKLKENLNMFENEHKDKDHFKEDLKRRLEDNEEQLKNDEKILDKIEKVADKINKQQLVNKLETLAKNNKNKRRSLEQLLELTKRFYVEKKLEKLNNDLEKLADDQEKLSEESNDNNTKDKQDILNKRFDDYKKQMDSLQNDNKDLKEPLDIDRNKFDENEIKNQQNEASKKLDQSSDGKKQDSQDSKKEGAKKNQKNAANKMKDLSNKMRSSMLAASANQIQEDVEMLRQVLDNLVLFSFDQEALMNKFNSIEVNHNMYATYLRKQQNLKEHFEHIDDSLFALSLRQPKISEKVNKEIGEVFFNINKTTEFLAENELYKGVSKQQFVITAVNNLADFLSNTLDNIQSSLSMSMGQGEGDQQLPDIIMSQEELNKMMGKGLKKGEGDKEKEGQGNEKGTKGSKEGKDNQGSGQNNEGDSKGKGNKLGEGDPNEDISGEIYKIYQRQQALRQSLENRILKEGYGSSGNKLVRKMKEIELDLLNQGFTNQTLEKMINIKHQLLKLENASFQQGEDNKRESQSNTKTFDNKSNDRINDAKQYFKTTEILNRQALPLQPVYKKKVQIYFKESND